MGGYSLITSWIVENSLTSAIGTGASLYGRTGTGGGILNLLFDGVVERPVHLNSTDSGTSSTLLWRVEGKKDDDHQILGWTTLADGQGVANIWLDYFE